MKTPLRDDGTTEASFLIERGIIWARGWLRNRLEGRDPLFPINARTDEDPSALVVRLFRDNGAADPGCQILASVLKEMLEESRSLAPALPGYFPELMNLCEEQCVPGLRDWFAGRLAEAAVDADSFQRTWGGTRTAKEIIFAARLQARAVPETRAYESWRALVQSPFYGTIALYALEASFPTRVPYLKEWWEACPPDHRSDELDQILEAAWKTEGEERLLALLASHAREHDWPKHMLNEVRSALRRRGLRSAFPAPLEVPVVEVRSNVEVVSSTGGNIGGINYNEAPVPGYEVGFEGRIFHVTQRFARLLHRTPADIEGKPESAFVWDPKAPKRKDIRPSLVAGGEGFFNFLRNGEARNGEADVPAQVTSQALPHFTSQRKDGFLVTLTDLRAASELRPWPSLTNTHYVKLLDKLSFYVMRKDTDSRLIYANRLFRDELRHGGKLRGPKGYLGLTDTDFYDDDLATRYQNDDRKVFGESVVEKIEEHQQEKEDERKLVHVIKVPLLGLDGRVAGLECVFWYLALREKALDALRDIRQKAHKQVKKVWGDVKVGFFQSTPDGRFLNVNPALAGILGYESPQAMIDDVQDIAQQFFAQPKQRRELEKRLETEQKIRGFVYQARRKNGLLIEVSENVHAIRDAAGKPLCYEGTIRVLSH